MKKTCELRPKLSAEELRKRQREYWRRWKERHAAKRLVRYGWRADFVRNLVGWMWKAQQKSNGCTLENGPFESLNKAKKDFLKAIE